MPTHRQPRYNRKQVSGWTNEVRVSRSRGEGKKRAQLVEQARVDQPASLAWYFELGRCGGGQSVCFHCPIGKAACVFRAS